MPTTSLLHLFPLRMNHPGFPGDGSSWLQHSLRQFSRRSWHGRLDRSDGALICGPAGRIVAKTQDDRIEAEMIVAVLTAEIIDQERSQPHFALKKRRPELFGDLLAHQWKG